MTAKAIIKMRINAAGFVGAATSVIAAYDPNTDILLVAREMPYEDGQREGFLLLTNQERDRAHDAVFDPDETRKAITAFFALEGLKLLNLGKSAQRLNPSNKVERIGMDQAGVIYQIAPDITNGQVAVLIASYYTHLQRGVGAAEAVFDALLSI